MSDLAVSMGLEGDVTIASVAKSTEALRQLLIALAGEVGSSVKIDWVPEDLRIGSLYSIYRARPRGDTTVAEAGRVVERYCELGERLERHEELPNDQDVVDAVDRLLKQARMTADELVLGTPSRDAIIDLRTERPSVHRAAYNSYGSVTGRVQTLSDRQSLQFVLYQEWTEQAVRCYARADQGEELRAIWGKRVCVHGEITRTHQTRRIVSIRHVSAIDVLPDEPERRFEDARGVLQWSPEDPSPERFIRELRDAE